MHPIYDPAAILVAWFSGCRAGKPQSLEPQRLDRIHPCGADGGVEAADETDEGRHRQRHDDARRRGVRFEHRGDLRQQVAEGVADHHAQRPAEQADDPGLDEELEPDVHRSRPDGDAHADLPRPLGYRDHHDVHDPDPADDQRDARDAVEHDGHDERDVAELVLRLLLGEDLEVVGFARAEVVRLAEDARDAVEAGGQSAGLGGLHDEHVKVSRAGHPLQRRDRDEHHVVHLDEAQHAALLHHAADDEALAVQINILSDGGAGAEEILLDLVPEDADERPVAFEIPGLEKAPVDGFVAVHRGVGVAGAQQRALRGAGKLLRLRRALHLRRGRPDGFRRFSTNQGFVIEGQRRRHDAAAAGAVAAAVDDDELVRPQGLEALEDVALHPFQHGNRGNHGCDADDDAQRRQDRPKEVRPEADQGHLEDAQEDHGRT